MKNDTTMCQLHILVADDDYRECRRVEDLLTELGAEIETASNGLVVIGLVRNNAFDLVLMDSNMPVMNGAKTARILRADPRFATLPLVCMMDSDDPLERNRLLGLGFSKLVLKPVTREMLEPLLAEAAQTRQDRQTRQMQRPLNERSGMRVFLSVPASDGKASSLLDPLADSPQSTQAKSPFLATAQQKGKLPGANAAAIPDLDGFDIAQGISRLMGNQALYLRLLGDFAQSLQQCVEDVRQADNEDDLPALLAVVHKIKGMSGNVAATRLYEYIVDLEKRLKADPETARKEPLRMVYPLMEATIATLGVVMPQAAEPEPENAGQDEEGENADESAGPLDPALEEALHETLCRVEEYATTAKDSFDEACALMGGRHEASRKIICTKLESFAFEEAKEELLKLTRTLGVASISKYEQ